ncbi:MAG: hypothetical protein FWH27_16960 [Planctomycetaceae bacterium]|nr:hypothetical protein [Planctomycetaceae bacterium]
MKYWLLGKTGELLSVFCDRTRWNPIPCVKPRMCVTGRSGAKVKVKHDFLEGRQHLPIIKVERC